MTLNKQIKILYFDKLNRNVKQKLISYKYIIG